MQWHGSEMENTMNFVEKIMLKMISHKVSRWFEMERSISKLDGATTSVLTSPAKSWPDPDKIPFGKEVPFNFKKHFVGWETFKKLYFRRHESHLFYL